MALKIISIRKDHPRYGFKRIFLHLTKKYMLKINKKRAYRVYAEQGLQLKRRKRKRNYVPIVESVFLRKKLGINIIRDIKPNRPFQIIRTDFTEIHTCSGKYHFIAYLCEYSKKILGWSLGEGPNTETTLKAFNQIIPYLENDSYIHQDQGSVFTSMEYISTLMKHNVFISYSEVGTPTDNGAMESFFGRFKDEWRDSYYWCKNINELYLLINNAVNYYNTQRIHTSIGEVPELFLTRNSKG